MVGTVALDSVKTPFGQKDDILGGSATYGSYAASFFAQPGIVAVVGDDFPQDNLQLLKEKGISTDGIEVSGKTFRWSGEYEFDMNEAKTLDTQLNALATFSPKIPEEYKEAKFLFLANIDPNLQLAVLEQTNADFVMLDSMNFWIESARDKLLEVISKVDVLLLNDGEARQLFNTANLVKAAKQAMDLGPKYVIFKKGEHGALLFSDGKVFNAPGYPLEDLKDPTGAGDSFAGAFIGYIAKTKDLSEPNIRKAVVYGSVVASFNVEDFSLENMKRLSLEKIEQRFNEMQELRSF